MKASDHIINGVTELKLALCFPSNVPESFLPKELKPVGESKFKGDSMPGSWSTNPFFTKGEYYPVYEGESNYFVVGSDKKGYKMHSKAWSKIYAID